MMLTIRTDAPTAEIGLYSGKKLVEAYSWEAGRQLSSQLLLQLEALLRRHGKSWKDLMGLVVFRGPGSFTGLRIGATVANTIAYAQSVAIVGVTGEQWVSEGVKALSGGANDGQIAPEYGAPANITKPRA